MVHACVTFEPIEFEPGLELGSLEVANVSDRSSSYYLNLTDVLIKKNLNSPLWKS